MNFVNFRFENSILHLNRCLLLLRRGNASTMRASIKMQCPVIGVRNAAKRGVAHHGMIKESASPPPLITRSLLMYSTHQLPIFPVFVFVFFCQYICE